MGWLYRCLGIYREARSHATRQGHSVKVAVPLWTDPGLKSEISVRELISTLKKKKRWRGMNGRTFSQNSRTREKSHHHHICGTTLPAQTVSCPHSSGSQTAQESSSKSSLEFLSIFHNRTHKEQFSVPKPYRLLCMSPLCNYYTPTTKVKKLFFRKKINFI